MPSHEPQREPSTGMSAHRVSLQSLRALMSEHRYVEVAGQCAELIESNPADHIPYLCLAQLAELAGNLEQAANYLSEAILRDPHCSDAYFGLSKVMQALGNSEFAIRALEVAVAIGGAGTETPLRLADLLYELGERDRAITGYLDVLQIDPTCGRSRAMLKLLGAAAPSSVTQATDVARGSSPLGAKLLSDHPAWREVHLRAICPNGYTHWAAFKDLMLVLEHAFGELGCSCTSSTSEFRDGAVNIIFGGHLIAQQNVGDLLPRHSVFYNLEQASGFGVDRLPIYRSLLQRFPVWDYSRRNIAQLKGLLGNENIRHVAIGFHPAMERIAPATLQTTDVLFYGSLNDRRRVILDELKAAGANVRHLFNVYGRQRDDAIRDAKIVLNLHFYEDSIHEIVRTSYLLANRKAVVTECNTATEIDPDIRQAMRAVPYEDVVGACLALLNDDEARIALEHSGHEIFRQRDQVRILAQTISETALA